jgi:uncharacterized protein
VFLYLFTLQLHTIGLIIQLELFVRLLDHLYKNTLHNNRYERLRKTGVASVLLHDIGHGPFSHATESIFGFNHEALSRKIVEKEMTDILTKEQITPGEVMDIIAGIANTKTKLLSQLVSSQLDVDRLDYLARDAYFTGAGFRVDLGRIIRTMTIYEDEGRLNGYAVVEEKGKHSIESYLLTRAAMLDDVYYHKTTRCVECLLGKVFGRVKILSDENKIRLPPELQFMKRNEIIPQDLLPLDDHLMYTLLNKWSRNSEDEILTDLSKRMINRKLLKSVDYTLEGHNLLFEKEKEIGRILEEKTRLNPDYYCIIDEPKDRPYSPIRSPAEDEEMKLSLTRNIYIKLKDHRGCKELTEVSDIARVLSQKKQVTRIYFPEEIRDEVKLIMKK